MQTHTENIHAARSYHIRYLLAHRAPFEKPPPRFFCRVHPVCLLSFNALLSAALPPRRPAYFNLPPAVRPPRAAHIFAMHTFSGGTPYHIRPPLPLRSLVSNTRLAHTHCVFLRLCRASFARRPISPAPTGGNGHFFARKNFFEKAIDKCALMC